MKLWEALKALVLLAFIGWTVYILDEISEKLTLIGNHMSFLSKNVLNLSKLNTRQAILEMDIRTLEGRQNNLEYGIE